MKKKLIIITAGIFATEILWQLYKRYRQSRDNSGSRSIRLVKRRRFPISEVLFFSEDSVLCHAHARDRESCTKQYCAVTNLKKLLYYICSSRNTLDVCLYFFTYQDLSNAIISAHERGVRVRIILDASMAKEEASQSTVFGRAKMNVRFRVIDFYMHHKFIIVDDDILITGSANWTMSAFFGNYDNILITNQRSLVKPFVEEFERMWIRFDSGAGTTRTSIQ